MGGLVHTSIDGQVAVCRLDSPETQNVLSREGMEELGRALERLDADPETRAIVVVGTDEFFASGPDIPSLRDRGSAEPPGDPATELWGRLAACETPVIAAVSGWALGEGCELALACDMVVASDTAVFGFPEVTLGMIPGGGGTQRVARVAGKQRAMELVLTGRRITAAEAMAFGLVNVVARKQEWLDRAMELAETIALRPPVAVRLAKRAIQAAWETPLSAGIEAERSLYEQAMATEDRIEGVEAFLEKRQPEFKGR